MGKILIKDIIWKTEPLDTGNLFRWSVLIGERKGKKIMETFKEDSLFDFSLLKAKLKVKRRFKLLKI